jgi:hypothetical protein
MTKNRAQRLGFGLLLLFYRIRGKFPTESAEIDSAAVEQIASQLGVPVSSDDGINTANRTEERHRAQIRTFFGFHEASVADAEMLTAWLFEQAAAVGAVPDHLTSILEARCRELSIEPPSADRNESNGF